MIIYSQETNDNLAEVISNSSSISYASAVAPCDNKDIPNFKIKADASIKDTDLYYVQSILVSSSWNRNDDIFNPQEIWSARKTPEDKPTNLEHDEKTIIGHITSNWTITTDGQIIPDDMDPEKLPEKFHIVTGSVIYRAFTDPNLRDRTEKLIAEIETGQKYVSMECYFKGFDYGITNKMTGEYKELARGEDTSYLTKYLKAYGGRGEHEDYKIGRVLKNITFSGKGFVDKPANPDSIIFSNKIFSSFYEKKNEDLLDSGVLDNKPQLTVETENNIMSENVELEKQVSEINSKLDTVSASCADQVAEAKATASQLEETNQTLEAAMKEKDEILETQKEVAAAELEATAKKFEEEKAAFAEQLETIKSELEASAVSKAEVEESLKAAQTSLEEANEVIAGYKKKEEEKAAEEKLKMRKASLVEAGLDEEDATAALEQFETLDDESFAAMTGLLKKKLPKAEMKKEEEEEARMTKPPKASEEESEAEVAEEAEAALEEAEAEDTVDLSVGSDESETESAEANVRNELVEFVSSRLGNL
jgi:hypothetical protein